MTTRIREAAEKYSRLWMPNRPPQTVDELDEVQAWKNYMMTFEAGAEWAIAEVLKELRSEALNKPGMPDAVFSECCGCSRICDQVADVIESRFKGE